MFTTRIPHRAGAALAAALFAAPLFGDSPVFEDFTVSPETRWEYIADGVMGGVSQGGAQVEVEDGNAIMRLIGAVSTDNNGGFIQVQRLLPDALPAGTSGLALDVRGNGEDYYVFIRTKEMTRPWYYYNVPFPSGSDWTNVELPLSAFERSHAHLAETIDPETVISIGLVAFGRDHDADLSVGAIRLY